MVAVSTDEHGRVLEDPPYGRYLDGPAMHALDVNATWKMRITQRLPRLIIPSTAFDAMLVGCCAVRCSSYVLARRLDPDVLARYAAADAGLTHPHPACRDANVVFALTLAHAIDLGPSPEQRRVAPPAAAGSPPGPP